MAPEPRADDGARREAGAGPLRGARRGAARLVWDYVTDWPRQGEWIPMTRVEALDAADRVGGHIRA